MSKSSKISIPPIHPFSSKAPNVGEIIMELSTKFHLNNDEYQSLEKFTSSLTIITKENFYQELLTNINTPMWWNESTALMIAVQEGNIDIVNILLKMGASIDIKNTIGNTALMIAAEHGELEILEVLLKNGANLNISNKYGQTALMLAIERYCYEVVDRILEIDPQQLNSRNIYHKNPLIIACEFGKYEIAKLIIERMRRTVDSEGALVNLLNSIHTMKGEDSQDNNENKPKKMGNTPLMFACRGDTDEHEEIALMLLNLKGINLNVMNQFGDSALSWAALAGRNNVISAIINHSEFQKPSIKHMSKILENLCSFDFADLSQSESTLDHLTKYFNSSPQQSIPSALPTPTPGLKQLKTPIGSRYHKIKHRPSFHNMTIREVNHEESLKAVLDYINKKYHPDEVYNMKYNNHDGSISTLKTGLIHGNIRVITLYFLRKDSESDLLTCDIDKILAISEQKEMLRRLSLRKDSLQLLVRLAALYNLHFDILKLYLKYIENSVGLLDTELPIFYRCLRYGCLDNLTSGNSDDGGVYVKNDIEEFELPDSFINFPKHLTHVNVVDKLVELSLLFSTESYKRPMERIDLLIHLKAVDNMLLECFKSESFASKETMQKFIEHHCNENSLVRLAHAFMRGPLARCIRHKTSIVFNSGHINSYVNKLYWGYMRDNSQNHIIKIRLSNKYLQFINSIIFIFLPTKKIPKRSHNLLECKSNLIFLRFNPSCMYFLEGLAKGILLSLLVYKVAYNYYYEPINISIIVMIISMVLYEYGELCDNKFISIPTTRSISNYFTSIWNILDDISFLLVLLGISSDYWDWDNMEYGRGYYSIAVIFNSISMLNYFGAYEPIGQLLIMVFAMTSDLMKFVFIFIFCIFGFCVAMYSLQKNQSSGAFSTRMKTFLSLFDAAFLNYENFDDVFVDHDRYYILGIIIEMVYIVFTAVVLLNLIIARMSATHDQIHKKSFEEWQYTRAFTVYSFLLLNERSPFSMLPPPFNLIPTFFSFFDYFHLWWNGIFDQLNQLDGANTSRTTMKTTTTNTSPPMIFLSISGTASDWLMGLILSFFSPILELIFYLVSTLYHDEITKCIGDLILILGIFPLLYPLFVISLIIQTLNIVTRIDLKGKKFSKKQLPICYYETQLPETLHSLNPQEAIYHSNQSTIDVKVIRVVGMLDYLHKNHLPIVQIQLQNVVNYCGNCIREGTTSNYVYSKSLLQFPLKQLDLDSNSIEISIFILDKDILTGRNEVIASVIVPSSTVREWIANGRFEGKIDFAHGRGAIQVVIATCILKGQPYFKSQNRNELPISPQQAMESGKSYRRNTESIQHFFAPKKDLEYQDDISDLFLKTTPQERTTRRRRKLLFDHLEIEKIFPILHSMNIKDPVEVERSRTPSQAFILPSQY